ncbi:hypothetical protein EB796_000400 [Bugula neritina]|uniref:Uncharacterized protein n=1 Tax=Bugula neritina TaxID=10212 RepID=A0A7J7KT47_BUGNE|nr:hypothetical protein EB796_000400 [Bugula neritina]
MAIKSHPQAVRFLASSFVIETSFILVLDVIKLSHMAMYRSASEKWYNINECETGDYECDVSPTNHIECSNTDGSYECICQDGFSSVDDVCVDVDECLEANLNECSEHARCNNTVGSYECVCQDGYEGNGFECTEVIGECEILMCDSEYTMCVRNSTDHEACVCATGYRVGADGGCLPTSCNIGSPCPSNTDCIPTESSFICECKVGFAGTPPNCENVNECTEGNPCGDEGTCRDTVGSYSCDCKDGYGFDGTTCVDINECVEENVICPDNQQCEDKEGSYECVCKAGYKKEENGCVNINECEEPSVHLCHDNAECIDIDGAYRCECREGYVGSGRSCADVDECLEGPSPCPRSAKCVNTAGTYTCECLGGYKYNNTRCIDIDECEDGQSCDENAKCANTDGGYRCTCNEGFRGNGFHCELVCTPAECPNERHTCHVEISARGLPVPECRCKCQGEFCQTSEPVCANNKQTYNSFSEFDVTRCENPELDLELAYWGECQETCDSVSCASYEVCYDDEEGPTCRCPECTQDLASNYGPVCTVSGSTFASLCALLTHACRQKYSDVRFTDGPCIQECEVTGWTKFEACSVSCGEGVKRRTRAIKTQPSEGNRCPDLEQFEACYMTPCPGSLCEDYHCPRPGAECILGSLGQKECECPRRCKGQDKKEVCGLLYRENPSTFYNLCQLKRIACLYDLPYTVLHDGSCHGTYVCIHTSAYIRLHTYVCIHTSAYIRLHTYVCIHVYKVYKGSCMPDSYICMHCMQP